MKSLVAGRQNYFTPNTRAAIVCRHVSAFIQSCDCSLIGIPELVETVTTAELLQHQSLGRANHQRGYSASWVHFSNVAATLQAW